MKGNILKQFEQDLNNNIQKLESIFKNNPKILNVTHKGCMDGCGCELILKNTFNNIETVHCTYPTIDKTLRSINYNNYDVVLITDIAPENDNDVLDISEKIILIDHHETAQRFHNPDKNRFVYNGKCGTSLTQKFCSIVTNTDLSYLDYFVYLMNDYDMWEHTDPRSKHMSLLFYKYWNEKFIKRFFEGVISFNKEELDFIKFKEHDFQVTYNKINFFEFESINGCFITAEEYINDICDKALHQEGFDIIFIRNTRSKNISVRSKIENFHIGNFFLELGIGGGHKSAGGINAPDVSQIQQLMTTLETKLYELVPSIRK